MQAITKLLKGATAVGAVALGLCFAVTLSTPAAATDVHQAIKMCQDNANCRFSSNYETGGLYIEVDTSEGHKTVSCPPKGPCSVQSKTPQGGKSSTVGKKGGKYAAGNVAAILQKPSAAVTRTNTTAVKAKIVVDQKKIGMKRAEDRRPRAGATTVNSSIKAGGGNQPVSLQRSGNSQRSGSGRSK